MSSSTNSRQPRKLQLAQRWSKRSGVSLAIDTTGAAEGIVSVFHARRRVLAERRFVLEPRHAGVLLRAVDAVLRSSGCAQGDLRAISVVPGPGLFSRVRLGVVTANALAWSLSIPLLVHGKRVRSAMPEYGAAPRITISNRDLRAQRATERSGRRALPAA